MYKIKNKKIAFTPPDATEQVAMIATNKLAPLDIYATSTTLPPLQSLVWYEFLTLFIYVLLSATLTELFLDKGNVWIQMISYESAFGFFFLEVHFIFFSGFHALFMRSINLFFQ